MIRRLPSGENVIVITGYEDFEAYEGQIIKLVLDRYKGNRTHTAEQLKLCIKTIRRKISDHHLPPATAPHPAYTNG